MQFLPFALALLAGLGLAGPAAAQCASAPQPPLPTAPLNIETDRGVFPFTVELATTEAQRSCGLMQRPRLAPDAGMLFDKPEPGPTYFWMKNTPEPLDMLFIGPEGEVLHVARHTTPYSTRPYGTDGPVAAVLELAAGATDRLGVRPGDRVLHEWFAGD